MDDYIIVDNQRDRYFIRPKYGDWKIPAQDLYSLAQEILDLSTGKHRPNDMSHIYSSIKHQNPCLLYTDREYWDDFGSTYPYLKRFSYKKVAEYLSDFIWNNPANFVSLVDSSYAIREAIPEHSFLYQHAKNCIEVNKYQNLRGTNECTA
jgi:hypothetical protein